MPQKKCQWKGVLFDISIPLKLPKNLKKRFRTHQPLCQRKGVLHHTCIPLVYKLNKNQKYLFYFVSAQCNIMLYRDSKTIVKYIENITAMAVMSNFGQFFKYCHSSIILKCPWHNQSTILLQQYLFKVAIADY